MDSHRGKKKQSSGTRDRVSIGQRDLSGRGRNAFAQGAYDFHAGDKGGGGGGGGGKNPRTNRGDAKKTVIY